MEGTCYSFIFFVYEIEFLTYTIFDDCKYEDDHFEEIFTNE